jgi:DNA-binding transcriptional LysR family regulator
MIPPRHRSGVTLGQLEVLQLLLEERSLTRAARALETSQSAVSKVLSKLRRHFQDPLFVRSGLSMDPTPRALDLAETTRKILTAAGSLQASPISFVPATSERTFNIFIGDGGIIRLLPGLMARVASEAPNLQLRAIPLEGHKLLAKLESGSVDLAVGAFPSLMNGIRRRRLYTEGYLTLLHKEHPQADHIRLRKGFVSARHVLVTSSNTGHAGSQIAERAIEALIPPKNIALRVPSFVAAAMVAKRTNTITTMPAKVATLLATELDLQTIEPPIQLPRVEIALYWHERFHRDLGNRWLRSLFIELVQ